MHGDKLNWQFNSLCWKDAKDDKGAELPALQRKLKLLTKKIFVIAIGFHSNYSNIPSRIPVLIMSPKMKRKAAHSACHSAALN